MVLIPDTRSLTDIITAILQRVGDDIDPNKLPQILVSLLLFAKSSPVKEV